VPLNDRNLKIAATVVEMANAIGKSPAQVALNWLRARYGVIPILGARKLSQFQDNLACLDWKLDSEQLEKLDDVSKIELGFPHDFLTRPQVSQFMHGGTLELIDR